MSHLSRPIPQPKVSTTARQPNKAKRLERIRIKMIPPVPSVLSMGRSRSRNSLRRGHDDASNP